MEEVTQKGNKMGYMPVPKVLYSMALPMILSMLVMALYNVVDSAFVARVSENALTAVSLAFPVQNIMIAVSVGTGVGMNALLSRYLGSKEIEEANKTAQNGIFLFIMSAIVFAILGMLGSKAFFASQTKDPEILAYGTQYTLVITVFSIGLFLSICQERLLQSTGKTVYNMILQATGSIVNIILDPILIFGLFGFPRLEVLGAAIATVIGQFVSMGIGIYYNKTKNKEINVSMKGFKPDFEIIKKIYEVGIPSIVMQSIGSIMVFGINKICLMYTPTAATVFGVYFKLQSFIFMPVFGLNNAMVPMIAFNYGARNKKRIMDTIWYTTAGAVGMMAAGTYLFQMHANWLLSLFDASSEMLAIGIPALRIISVAFIFAGYNIVIGSVFQALGNGMYSLWVSIARQLIVILPVAYLLSLVGGLDWMWLAFPISEVVAVIMTAIMFGRINREKLKPLTVHENLGQG